MAQVTDVVSGLSIDSQDSDERAKAIFAKIQHSMTLNEPDTAKLATWLPSTSSEGSCHADEIMMTRPCEWA